MNYYQQPNMIQSLLSYRLIIDIIYLNYNKQIQTMIGPHYERLAEIEKKLTAKQILEKVTNRNENPINKVIDKLKKQFNQYDTAYTDDITNHQISSVDRLLTFDSKFGPILSTLEKQNNLLRREIQVLENQLSNTVGICEQLVNENSEQKKIVEEKNSDILKIIESIACNESEARNQLEEKIVVLQQQNGILIQHLEEIKKSHEEAKHRFEDKDQEILSWRNKWQEAKKNLNDTISKEHDLARKLSLAENNLYEETEKLYDSTKKLQALQFENNQLNSELLLLKQDLKESNVELIKHRLEQEYKEIVNEHRALKKQIIAIRGDADHHKNEKIKAEDQIRHMQGKFTKILQDLERATTLLHEQKQKNATMVSTLDKIQEKLHQNKNECVRLQAENQAMKTTFHNKQSMLEQRVESLNRQLFEKSQEMQGKLKQIRSKTQQLLNAKDMQLQSLNDTNTELRRQLGHF